MKINWKDHLVNLLVVILGISIAFFLEQWREDRKDHKLRHEYLNSLISDIDHDLEELVEAVDTLRKFEHQNKRLTETIITEDFDNDSLFYFVTCILNLTEFIKKDNTYHTLQASGNFTMLGDFEFRNELTDLYNSKYAVVEVFDRYQWEFVHREISSYINRNVRFTGRPEILDKRFLQDVYFTNLSFNSLYLMRSKIAAYDSAIVKAQRIKARINEILAE